MKPNPTPIEASIEHSTSRTVRVGALIVGFVGAVLALAWPAGPAGAEALRVFAAASLTDAFGQLGKDFEAQHEGCSVEFNFGGSQLLRTQIEQGAPADVFASADNAQMDPLVQAEVVGAAVVFAHNDLVVAASARSGRVRSLGDLARPGVRVVVAGPTVPVGRYTTQVLGKVAAAGTYGDDFQTRVTANVRSQETNVRAVLSKVLLGEADAGFVYRTDVSPSEKVVILEIPARMNVVAAYPIAVVRRSGAPALAQQFVDLVTGERGRAELASHGFKP